MGTIARGTKAAGGTAFVDGTGAEAGEVNTDFDTLYNEINGNLDEDNLAPATQIPNSMLVTIEPEIVNDSSVNEAALAATLDAGDSSSVTLPTDLREELQALRYRVRANRHMTTNLQYMLDAGTLTSAYWTEPAPNGPNLAPNPGLEAHSGTSTDAPTGWSLVGTPTTMGPIGPGNPSQGLEKRAFRVVTDAASEGISFAVSGLKSSTKYLVGATYTLIADEMSIITASGLATGDYKNVSYTDTTTVTATETATRQFIVQSTSVPGSISVSFLGTNSGADFKIHSVWFYELSEAAPREVPSVPIQTATYSTVNDSKTDAGTGTWHDLTDLSLSQYIPAPGYRLVYETTICWRSDGNDAGGATASWFAARVELDSGTGDSEVEGPYALTGTTVDISSRTGGAFTMRHVVDNPTPGLTYAFKTGVYIDDDSNSGSEALIMNPTLNGTLATVSQSKCYLERL